ncbi:MAG: NfeD family protein [Dialister sp.]|nr:NfeD family protein [Dialister sp.]
MARALQVLSFLSALFLPRLVYASDGESFVAIIKNPVVEGLLAGIIILSIIAEIKTAGFSGGSLVASVAGCLLIGANWYSEGGQVLEFVLYFGGLALIIMDILFLMTGALCVCGFVFMMSGLFFSFGGGMAALYVLSAGLLLAMVGAYFLAGHLSRSRLWDKIALSLSLKSRDGYVSSVKNLQPYVGQTGTADTVLRPAGIVHVGSAYLDAVSEGEFIEKGDAVTVLRAEGGHLVVRKNRNS